MLIDTSHIDHLRVNFVAHFNTENNVRTAANEITTLMEKYPREMTSQVRQWLNEQQKTRVNTSLTTVDASKTIDQFEEYLKELEENINEPNQINFKVSFPFFLGMK
jgi:transcriptional regulatory protein LevR